MLDTASQSLWAKVCATVTKLGESRDRQQLSYVVQALPEPDFLDLHGMTVQEAHRAVMAFLDRSNAPRILTIVTGLSGVICREFPHWIENHKRVSSVVESNGGGAFTVRLKRPK